MKEFFFAFATILALTGCSKQAKPVSTPEPEGAGPASSNRTTAAAAPAADAQMAGTLDQLTQAVRKYSAEKQKVPKSLNEVVAAGYLTEAPAAPPGKKFVIDPKRVQVVVQ